MDNAKRKRAAAHEVHSPPATRARLTHGDIISRIASATDWSELFERDDTLTMEDQLINMRAVRNRLVRMAHPDRASNERERQLATAASANLNRLWDQALHSEASVEQKVLSGAALSLLLPRPSPAVEPGGSLEMLTNACVVQNSQPPTMLERPELGVFVGFGNLDTLRRCRFVPMATNRCISQDVVAQRVGQNLKRLREEGSYFDFGQSSASP